MHPSKPILCFVFFLLSFSHLSQTLRFEKFTTKDGLPSDEIYNLHQDTKGYIWVFTNYGALKYNGKEFKPVVKNLPFNESFIYSIFENKQGRKWIANSNAKVYEIINDSAFLLKGLSQLSELLQKQVHEIYQINVDDSLNIFLVTKHWTFKLIKKNDFYTPINISELSYPDSSNYKIIEKDNFLLLMYRFYGPDQVSPFHTRNNFKVTVQTKTDTVLFRLVSEDFIKPKFFKRFGEDIYFSAYNRFGRINKNNKISFITFKSNIQNFVRDKRNHTWVAAYYDGIYELDANDSIVNHYLQDLTINDILIDSENGLWASSDGGGLYHCENLNNLHFSSTEPLGIPINIIKIIDSVLFIANGNGDIFTVHNGVRKTIKKTGVKNTPHDLIKFNSHFLISYLHSAEEFEITDHSNLKVLKTAATENAIKLMAYEKNRVIYLNRNAFVLVENYKRAKLLKVGRKMYSFEIRKGVIFIAADKGICQLKQDVLNEFLTPSFLSKWIIETTDLIQPDYLFPTKNSVVTKIVKHEDDLWFCTKGNGLFKLTLQNKLVHITAADGLPSNIINNISFNSQELVLLSTNKGLFVTKEKEIEEGSHWFRIYTEEVKDALLFEQKIYASTSQGLIILDSERINEKEKIYFNLSSVFINAKESSVQSLNNIAYNQNNLEFNFDLISFSDNKHELVYNLYGPYSEKGHVKNDNLKLQNLPHGKYTLTVYPSTNKNLQIKLQFHIIPAFWQTKLFQVACFILILAFGFGLIRIIFLNVKSKEIKKLHSERLISEFKLSALKAQMDPHFIFNSLNTIQQFIIVNDNEKAQLYLSTFSQLIRMLLESNTNERILLKQEMQILEKYLEIESLRFNNAFDYEIVLEEGLDPMSTYIPYFLVQPFVENAIHHGLLPKIGYKEITITFKITDPKTLTCTVDDNGIGRKNSTSKTTPFKHKSLGIVFIQQHLAIISKIEKKNFKVEIKDKETENSKGTTVIITMPFFNK